MGAMTIATKPNRLVAHATPSFSYSCVINSGNAADMVYLESDDAPLLDAPYFSAQALQRPLWDPRTSLSLQSRPPR